MAVNLADVITCVKFQDDIFRGYNFTGGRISHFRIHFLHGPNNSAARLRCLWYVYWLQLCSSDESPQSLSPSQTQFAEIHLPVLWHWNWCGWHVGPGSSPKHQRTTHTHLFLTQNSCNCCYRYQKEMLQTIQRKRISIHANKKNWNR